MKPHELWLSIGAIIAEEARCTEVWDFVDGSQPIQMCGPVTIEQRKRIAERALFELVLTPGAPKVTLGPELVAK
jgi:hypothetical protein